MLPSTRSFACKLTTLAALTLLAPASEAHLSLIRPHWESNGVVEADARHGAAVAAGDFDGDGFDDIASGAPDAPNGNGAGATTGSVVINYGAKYGLTHVGAATLLFNTSDSNGRFGRSLATGDFDGDGHDDLAVGHPGRNHLAFVDAGAIHIYEGEPAGLAILPAQTFLQEDVSELSEIGDEFGWSMAAGHYNDDAYEDLVVSAVGEDLDAGAVYLFLGTANGLAPVANVKVQPSSIGEANVPGDRFGHSLAAGDVIDGAQDDFAVGAPFRNGNLSVPDAGRVWVFPGATVTPNVAGGFSFDADDLGGTSASDQRFGWSLAAGRLAGAAALNRLAIGETPGGTGGPAGRCYVTPLSPFPPGVLDVEILDPASASLPGVSGQLGSQFAYSLAAGDLDADGDDELAVGIPGYTAGAGANESGLLYLLFHQGTSLTDSTDALDGWVLNDVVQSGWRLGEAIAAGAFDAYGRDNLAVGAPGADFRVWECMGDLGLVQAARAGQVHVFAPWRQVPALYTQSAVARDCDGEVMFSQRPFDPLAIASTTKVMTVFLACEDVDAMIVDLGDDYTVRTFIGDCFDGSGGGLVAQETVALEELMRRAIDSSAGDACNAIGDFLTGEVDPLPADCAGYGATSQCKVGPAIVLPTFVQRMNTRATQLGMVGTHFTNPHGSTLGSGLGGQRHHSTAWDMTLLMRAAMQSQTFRDIVDHPDNGLLDDINPLAIGQATGAKSGFNTFARGTGIAAAVDSTVHVSDVVAGSYGTHTMLQNPASDRAQRAPNLKALLELALQQCVTPTPVFPLAPLPLPTSRPELILSQVPADDQVPTSELAQIEGQDGDLVFDVFRQTSMDASTEIEVCLGHVSSRAFAPGETGSYGYVPFWGQKGLRVTNFETMPRDLQITVSHPPSSQIVQVPAGGSYLIPASSGSGTDVFSVQIQNLSSAETTQIRIEQLGYCNDLSLGGVGGPDSFQAALTREPGDIAYETIFVDATGRDTTPGNTVAIAVGTGSITPTDAPAPPAPPVLHSAVEVRAWPNPAVHHTTIGFALDRRVNVELTIYDVRGRVVDRILSGHPVEAGTHRYNWDGMDSGGRQVSSGVYFARLRAGREVVTTRIVRVLAR